MSHPSLHAIDFVVGLWLCLEPGASYRAIARATLLGQASVHRSVDRLFRSGLMIGPSRDGRLMNRSKFLRLLRHAVPTVFFPVHGEAVTGVPTAGAALSDLAEDRTDSLVWPGPGTTHGIALSPLYDQAPLLADRNPMLYRALCLVDVMRTGSPELQERALLQLNAFVREHLAGERTSPPVDAYSIEDTHSLPS